MYANIYVHIILVATVVYIHTLALFAPIENNPKFGKVNDKKYDTDCFSVFLKSYLSYQHSHIGPDRFSRFAELQRL
jgi:hypothetical protein